MNQLQPLFSQVPFAHHAYGVESSGDLSEIIKALVPHDQCSYVFCKTYDSFKIDDARTVKSLQSERTEKASVFILEFSFINIEAQNALLKVLEEPTINTYFILVFPQFKKLLPTLQSRLSYIRTTALTSSEGMRIDATSFLAMSLQERFNLIKQLTDKKSGTPLKKKDVLKFLDALEHYFYQENTDNAKAEELQTVFDSRNYLHAKGASMKMVLENIAMNLK